MTYINAQGWVQRGADIAVTFANGDVFGARAKANGQVEVYKNGTLVAARDVTAWPHYANGGYIGLWLEGADTSMMLDDFGGGTVAGGFAPGKAGLYSLAALPNPKRDSVGRALKPLAVSVPSEQTWKVYYYASAQMIAMREISGTTGASTLYYLHSDHLGSTSLVTNASGGVVSRQSYYAYGRIRANGNFPTDIGFTAQRNDGLGLMNFRAREFSVYLGP